MTTTPSSSKSKMKLAVLTSGGDSAGMNAVVRAVVKAGILRYICGANTEARQLTSFTEAAKHGLCAKAMRASSAAMQTTIKQRKFL